MEGELKKQTETRAILEEIAGGTEIGDTVLVPIMQQNEFDVDACVNVLLEFMGEGGPGTVNSEELELAQQRELMERFKREAEENKRKVQLEAEQRAEEERRREMEERNNQQQQIATELAKKEEQMKQQLAAKQRELEQRQQEEMEKLGNMLEQQWKERMEQKEREIEERKRKFDAEKQEALQKHLDAISKQFSNERARKVEAALKLRIEEEKELAKKLAEEAKVRFAVAQGNNRVVTDEPETNDNNNNNNESSSSSSGGNAAAPAKDEKDARAEVTIELKSQRSAAKVGSRVTVYWEYKSGRPSKSDWIGYFKRSRPEDSNQYYTYQKTGGSEKGSVEFTIPNKFGICEFRFFQNNSYTIAARSEAVRVGNSVKLTASFEDKSIVANVDYHKDASPSTWDWVALFEMGEKDNRAYYKGMSAYVTSPTLRFQVPKKPGSYILRYFMGSSGYSELATSNVIVVNDDNVLSVQPKIAKIGEVVTVSWDISSRETPSSTTDWVGLFSTGEVNPFMAQARQNSGSDTAAGCLSFSLSPKLAPGNYVFAFFSKGAVLPLKQSDSFTIEA